MVLIIQIFEQQLVESLSHFYTFFLTRFSNTSQVGAGFLPATLSCFFLMCLFWFSIWLVFCMS